MEWTFLSDLATSSGRHRKRLPAGLLQHPDQHRPERPVLLAVDQQLGEGAGLWEAPQMTTSRMIHATLTRRRVARVALETVLVVALLLPWVAILACFSTPLAAVG